MILSENLKRNKLWISIFLVAIIAVILLWTKNKNTDSSDGIDRSGAVEVVKQYLDDKKNDFGVISFSVNSVQEVHNAQHIKNILGDEDAVKMGLTEDNIALVDAYVNAQYDNTKVPTGGGENQYIGFALVRKDKSTPWIIANSGQGMGGVRYIDFNNLNPKRSAELYVWKNRAFTGNDNTYFTVLNDDTNGINKNRAESEIYDLGKAFDSIDAANLLLAGIPNLTKLAVYQMNTTDFTKQEMSEIADKIVISADNHSISIGLWKKGTQDPGEPAYFGTWVIKKQIPTPNVTALSQEQIDGYLGQEITVNAKQIRTGKGTIENPHYEESSVTNEQLYNNWLIQFDSLEVTDDTVTEINVANYRQETEDGIGSGFILTNDRRLFTIIGGVLFELGFTAAE
ncbi:DUF4829 domain-containing protein [Desulfosporosinus shakirovi]|uniref:DUF4829 domain-containing protein n=1 Tax=Desulfosporosinus shakirovi TaxID=2885154 RepID=UPI001E5E7C0E|nr:DUF4829 domain-containing protein [Desulfosporosinus sp. SRJS8]MCB8815427.1 DUF4829 domain-containing protein [Desulfosporosinus sp. SRJS8]